ncbi:MAG TPA: hypothetical protein VLW85_09245 [Myxococcales bacterium]|nr:hypothetical protein [Myxococcales bacterium]
MANLRARAWTGLCAVVAIMGAALFLCAGTLRYWQAFIYLLLFFSLSAAVTVDLIARDPALLERRLKGGPTAEARPVQRVIMLGASIGFLSLMVLPALDFRRHGAQVRRPEVEQAIGAGRMPRDQALDGMQKMRILRWFACGAR